MSWTSPAGKWLLLTFGGGSSSFEAAAARLGREARSSGWFDRIIVETPRTLMARHEHFWSTHGKFISLNPRLYGYAIWKPYLIRHHLRHLPSGWGLCYLDAGCVLNPTTSASDRMDAYRELASESGIWATQLDQPRWGMAAFPEESWTKQDALDAVKASLEARSSPQYQSGMIMLVRTSTVDSCLDLWADLAVRDDYHLSSDEPSARRNAPGFVEHRHDQSLFSLAAKAHGLTAVSDETWFAPDWFGSGRGHPIWAARWRTGQRMRPWSPRYVSRVLRRSWMTPGAAR